MRAYYNTQKSLSIPNLFYEVMLTITCLSRPPRVDESTSRGGIGDYVSNFFMAKVFLGKGAGLHDITDDTFVALELKKHDENLRQTL